MDINKNTAFDFDPFAIEDIPKEVLNKIRDKSILNDIFRMQNRDSIICGFYCTTFIEYMLAETTFLHYTNLFTPIDHERNDKIIYK